MSAIKRRIGLIGFGAIGKDVATRLLSVSGTPLNLTVLTRKPIPGVSRAFETAPDAEY
jgi:predicted homoserine dehydrogenase-like protein